MRIQLPRLRFSIGHGKLGNQATGAHNQNGGNRNKTTVLIFFHGVNYTSIEGKEVLYTELDIRFDGQSRPS
jgi:hypothetical protein